MRPWVPGGCPAGVGRGGGLRRGQVLVECVVPSPKGGVAWARSPRRCINRRYCCAKGRLVLTSAHLRRRCRIHGGKWIRLGNVQIASSVTRADGRANLRGSEVALRSPPCMAVNTECG